MKSSTEKSREFRKRKNNNGLHEVRNIFAEKKHHKTIKELSKQVTQKLCACGVTWEQDSDQFGCWSCGTGRELKCKCGNPVPKDGDDCWQCILKKNAENQNNLVSAKK